MTSNAVAVVAPVAPSISFCSVVPPVAEAVAAPSLPPLQLTLVGVLRMQQQRQQCRLGNCYCQSESVQPLASVSGNTVCVPAVKSSRCQQHVAAPLLQA